jgi:predicted RNase H-like HicB family nuclease
MKTTALIERAGDGIYSIFTPDIQTTIVGGGDTIAKAKADFELSVKAVFDYYAESGKPIPAELQGIEFEYKYDMASVFDYFGWINVSKFAEHIGINPSLMRQYRRGGTYISETQAARIENGLHQAGRDLLSVTL